MKNILVSIIIPHYNSSKLLTRLIESIPINDKIEIIIVDDKSDLKEKVEVGLYINRIIKQRNIIFLENNGIKSAGTCRNIGIKNASGKWILFADSDDFFTSGFFECINNYISTNYDIIFFKPISCYSDTLLPADRHVLFCSLIDKYIENEKFLDELKYKFMVPWSKLILRSFILKNKIFFDETIASNDVMFSVKSAYYAKNNIKVSNENIYCVTVRKGSLTLRKNKEIFEAKFLVHQERNKFYEKINKKKYCSLGLSYIFLSRKYGIKYFIFIFKEVLKNYKYCFNNFKSWKQILVNIYIGLKNKKYYTK